MRDNTLDYIIDSIYGVLENVDALPFALEALAGAFHAEVCGLHRHDTNSGLSRPIACFGSNEDLRWRLGPEVTGRHPLLTTGLMKAESGTLWRDDELLPRHEREDTLYWTRWLAPQRLKRCAIGVVNRDEMSLHYLELLTSNRAPDHGSAATGLIVKLLPHLARVLRLLPRLPGPDGGRAVPPAASRIEVLPMQARLRGTFGLTRAETRVVNLLMTGITPDAAAKRLGVAISTVRTHLQNIYMKTGTGRQSELIAWAHAGARHEAHSERMAG